MAGAYPEMPLCWDWIGVSAPPRQQTAGDWYLINKGLEWEKIEQYIVEIYKFINIYSLLEEEEKQDVYTTGYWDLL